MIDWHSIAGDYYANKPSVQAPGLSNREFARAVRLASATKFGGAATPQEASAFWGDYHSWQQSLDHPMSDEEFLHHLDTLAPVSFRYHGRPPKLLEIAKLRDATPKQQRDYFGSLPDKTFPDMSAHEMLQSRVVADHYAKRTLGRPSLKVEAHLFHHSSASADTISQHYQFLAQDKEAKDRANTSVGGGEPAPPSAAAPGQQRPVATAPGARPLGG